MKMLLPLTIVVLLASGGLEVQAQSAKPSQRPVVTKKSGAAAPVAPAQAYWYDGAVRRPLAIDPDAVADFTQPGTAAPRGRPRLTEASATAAGKAGANVSPVFRGVGAPASEVRALPGGIIVTLRTASTAEAANQLLAPFGLSVTRPVDGTGLRWVVATAAGMAALETANRLHESGAFAAVTPDWWIGVTKK
ncbi:MAG: hypothetical protein K0B16_12050 [Burkholderiaceae bacterium]|nr:hypothetical protein [Burkholderiaceae bacterium]